ADSKRRHRALAEFDTLHSSAGERISFRVLVSVDGKRAEFRPGAGEDAMHAGGVEVGGPPAGRAGPWHRLPHSSAVRRAEHAGGKCVRAVATDEATLLVDEADIVQAGQHVGADLFPGDAASVRFAHDA